MNTSKQVNVMLGLFMVFLIGTTLYFLWDSSRAEEATERQLRTNAERGASLYSLNCRSCHGITGMGAAERGTLPGAPLNLETYRPETAGMLGALQNRFGDTITCGRIGTVMPPWSQEQGGPLNFFQIQQLVTFITGSMPVDQHDPPPDPNAVSEEAWEFVWEEANHTDAFTPHKELAEAIGVDDTVLPVGPTDGILVDAVLRLGGDVEEPAYELVRVTAIDEEAGEVTVERGVEGSMAMEHEAGTEVFGGFVPPGTTITGEGEGVFVCGQPLRGPTGDGGETVQIADGDSVSMMDDFFDVGGAVNPTLEITAGSSLTLNLPNDGLNTHNMRVDGGDGEYTTDDDLVSDPQAILGGAEGTIELSFDGPGTFIYRCDFHPTTMLGEVEVVE